MSQQIPLWYACLIVFVVGAGSVAVWSELKGLSDQRWHEARRDACASSARARAAEHPYRRRLHPGDGTIEAALTPRADLPADDMDRWLAEWHTEVEEVGLPFLTAMAFKPADVVFDPDSYLPKIVVPITTGRLRAITGMAA